jgi:hypothetical protein
VREAEEIRTSSSDVSSSLGQRFEAELEVDQTSSHYEEQLEHHVDGSGLEETESVSAIDANGHTLEQRTATEITPDGHGETTTATKTDNHRRVFTKTVLTGAAIAGALLLIASFKAPEPPPPIETASVPPDSPLADPIATSEQEVRSPPALPKPVVPSEPTAPRVRARRKATSPAVPRSPSIATPSMAPEDPVTRAVPSAGGMRMRTPDLKVHPLATETLDDSQILLVLREHKNDIAACRDKQLEADPAAEGQMTVTFAILPTGEVSRPTVRPPHFTGSVLGECVVASVSTWRFPAFSGRPLPLDFPVTLHH